MARPRPTPLPEGSTQNMAIEEIRLKSSEPVQTGHQRKQGKKESCWRTSSTAAVFVALLQTCGRQVNLLYPKEKCYLWGCGWRNITPFIGSLCLLLGLMPALFVVLVSRLKAQKGSSFVSGDVGRGTRTSSSTCSQSLMCNGQMKIKILQLLSAQLTDQQNDTDPEKTTAL